MFVHYHPFLLMGHCWRSWMVPADLKMVSFNGCQSVRLLLESSRLLQSQLLLRFIVKHLKEVFEVFII